MTKFTTDEIELLLSLVAGARQHLADLRRLSMGNNDLDSVYVGLAETLAEELRERQRSVEKG